MVSKEFLAALNGSTSSVIANALVYPLDVITTKVQVKDTEKSATKPESLSKKKSKLQIISEIIKDRGISGLYIGIDFSLLQTFWSNFGYFYFYSWIKRLYFRYYKTSSVGTDLLLGAIAGGISRAFTTPISVITTRLQAGSKQNLSSRDIWNQIWKDEGISGLWRGLNASLILTINPALTYGLFEQLKHYLPKRPTPFQSFLIGAFTKSVATVVTYPYILAKTRLQAGRENSVLGCLLKVLKQDGIPGMYEGLNEQLSKSVLCQAILFALKDYLALIFNRMEPKKIN